MIGYFKSATRSTYNKGSCLSDICRYSRKLGRDDIGTHTLRKTFGYHYYKKTRDIATLMFIFNHSSQAITKRYIGITEDEIGASLRGFKLGG
ncbi:tyrosine-type recombinase/integrase [Enterococcus sp. 079]|nr:tyrosine-type recombinase/integrase [Enterococcus sp. 079]